MNATPTEPQTTRAVAPAFRGWLRRHAGQKCGRWEIAATGATAAEVSDKLFRLLSGTTGHVDTMTLPGDQDP